MPASYSSLRLGDVMMHQIIRSPSGEADRFQTITTDEPVSMNASNLTFLTDRFIKALTGRALPIVEDATVPSNTPAKVRSLWSGSLSLTESSQHLAEELRASQPGSALAGLLVVAEASLGGDDALLVAKVEHQAAMRIETETTDDGHTIFRIEQLRELVFGDGAKIYKIAVLSRVASATGQLAGEVVDDQNGNRFAAYFLGKFMGMKLREEPAVLTQNFLERMTGTINESSMDPETKLDVQAALLSQLNSNLASVSPRQFIQNFVPPAHQTEIDALAQQKSVPLVDFPRDTSRVNSQIRQLRMDMSNGIRIIAPAESVGEGKAVQIEDGLDGDTVTITGGKLRNVRGNGSR